MAASPAPVLLLDSASLYFRSYFAMPSSMTAPDGHPHGAVRGFLSTLGQLLTRTGAQGVVACWDADWRPQWRVDLVPSYKTHRLADDGVSEGAEPDELEVQAEAIADILDAAGVARVGVPDYEADDVVASLTRSIAGPTVTVTGDRDLMQVASERARVLLTVNGGMDKWPLLDRAGVLERFGVRPEQYVDMAVLRGDASDGLPGVPGIGAKTAPALIAHFGSLDLLLDAARTAVPPKPLTPRIAANLVASEESVRAQRAVATARTDLDIDVDWRLPAEPRDAERLDALLDEWGVRRFLPAFAQG